MRSRSSRRTPTTCRNSTSAYRPGSDRRATILPGRSGPEESNSTLRRRVSSWTRKGRCRTLILRIIPSENRFRFSGSCASWI
ncbi:MAG: hypothetical protein EOR02_16800 [Mesorhizobium sp.]|nr:MAG: hypothetical protein EOR02_16800 [Mesorhizobium sp.]